MTEEIRKSRSLADVRVERTRWERPDVRRLEAGTAEAAGGTTTDLSVLS